MKRLIVAAFVLVGSSNADANVLTNGSFEDPFVGDVQAAPTAWIGENAPANIYITTASNTVTDGSQAVQIGGYLSQVTSEPTIPGMTYKLEFDYTNYNTSGFSYAQVFANPTSTNDGIDSGAATDVLLSEELPVANTTNSTPPYQQVPFSFTFVAPASSEGKFLSVRFLTATNYYRGYDNVRLTAAPPGDDADFDGDGDVDGADFLTWQRGVGTPSPTQMQGNANDDDAVDGEDLDVWKTQFGMPATVAAASEIPEPGSVVLLAVGGFVLGTLRRRGDK